MEEQKNVILIDVSLEKFKEGAAVELFKEKFAEVLANIANERTSATDARKIVLTFIFTPNEERDITYSHVEAESKLAKISSGTAVLKLDFDGRKINAKEQRVKQLDMFIDREDE